MNKYEEAWNNVRSLSETSDYYKPYNDDKDIKLIGELIEKETPKKAKQTVYNAFCPNCRYALGRDFAINGLKGFVGTSNCPNCGQMIDWSD